MFFLVVLFPIVEIYLLVHFAGVIGIANTFFFILASGVFGYGLIRAQGSNLQRNFGAQIAQNKVPADAMFKSLLTFFAGVLMFVPGYITTALGVLLILPGTRQLLALLLKRKLASKIADGTFAFGANGAGFSFGGFGAQGPFGSQGPFGNAAPGMRDVSPKVLEGEIIDVTPVKKD